MAKESLVDLPRPLSGTSSNPTNRATVQCSAGFRYVFSTVRVTVALRVEVAVPAQTRLSGLGTKSNLDMSSRVPRCSKERESNSIPSRT